MVGEGLAGQCYLEKATLLLTDVPANYVRITSGLGQAPPTCVLILPLLVNNAVEGVFELASFRVFAPHEIDFLEKLCEGLAGAVRNQRANARTLLEAAQQQTEALHANEEELRQNLEELTATQEHQRRLQEELHHKMAELEASKRKLEELQAA